MANVEELRLERDGPASRKGIPQRPVGKAKSVVFTEEGLAESKRLFEEMFGASIAE